MYKYYIDMYFQQLICRGLEPIPAASDEGGEHPGQVIVSSQS